ncbi:MAG: LPS export ABC transporter periplasmic protein LptC [Phormidesmis sp.]
MSKLSGNKRWYQWLFAIAAIGVLLFGLRTCFSNNDLVDSEPQEEIAAELTLRSVTLEQPDEDGTLLWKLTAESVNYTPDTQRADVVSLEGEFFQDGEPVYTVEADRGEVLQNGNTLFLRGNLIATGRENELTLEGEKLKWLPKQDLLVMGEFEDTEFELPAIPDETPVSEESATEDSTTAEDRPNTEGESNTEDSEPFAFIEPAGEQADPSESRITESTPPDLENAPVTGFNQQIKTVSRLIKVNNKENRVELTGGVLAESKEAPWLLFESDELLWFTEREIIEANQPLKVEQFESEAYEVVSDRLVGKKGQVELAENIVTLSEGVQLDSLTESLTVNGEQAVWDVDAETVAMDQPVDIKQPERQITAAANQASLDLAEQIIYLTGDVRAVSAKNDARLNADSVVWETTTQQVEAEGNVRYQQADDPDISIAGPRAIGNIEAGTLAIEGGSEGDVVTEIVPEEF